jgi:cell wall-associated NlpC family hydrolase
VTYTGAINRARRMAVLGLAWITLTLVLTVASPAAAEPPLTVAEAKAQIQQLETDAAALDQQYVGVQEKLKLGHAELRAKQADVQAQTKNVMRLRTQVGQVALAEFQNQTLEEAARLLLSEDTDSLHSEISTVKKIGENHNATLQDFQQQQASLTELQRSVQTDVSELTDQQQLLEELRTTSDQKVAEAKTVLAKLTEQERRLIAAEEAKAAAEARQKAEQAGEQSPNSDEKPADSTAEAGQSGRGATAMAFARKQLGKPYRFGAAGPAAYDCSGLTLSAWRAAGVSLPRISQQQYRVGRAVAKSDLQPGDLVFFYDDLSHVSLYAGNGMILDAPRPGKTVRYIDMSYMPYVGARRPG